MIHPSHLRRGQLCVIHHSYFCCGREQYALFRRRTTKDKPSAGWEFVSPGLWRIEDAHHPRGYRERRSKAKMRELLDRKIVEQDRRCALCGEKFTDYREIIAEHIEPKGMGSARRDDHPSNIQAAHSFPCNAMKGSKRKLA